MSRPASHPEAGVADLVGRPERPAAAVVMGVTTNGLAFVRSLGRRGIPVVIMDTPEKPGMRSRLGAPIAMPDVCLRPDAWLAKLEEVADGAARAPVLIPTGDEHVLLVSAHGDRLAARFRFRIPSPDVVEMLCDKRRQYDYLRRRGWPLPRTELPQDGADIVSLAERTVGFPCVLKPQVSHRWMRRRTGVKLRIARDAAQLRLAHREMVAAGESPVLQELIPGPDDALHGVLAAYGTDGRLLAAFTKRKLRQQPLGAGNGSLQVSTRDPELVELAQRVLAPLGYRGLVSIELKWDDRDRRHKIIEINPRGVSGNQLAIDCGVDFPLLYYLDAIGERPAPPPEYRTGVKYLHLGWHLAAMAELWRGGALAPVQELRALRGVSSFALFDRRDARPFFAYALGALREASRRAARRAAPGAARAERATAAAGPTVRTTPGAGPHAP